MNQIRLKKIKKIQADIKRLKKIAVSQDLALLHKFTNDLQITLPLEIVHENRKILLDGFRVNHEQDVAEYCTRLEKRLVEIIEEIRNK